MTGSGRLRSLSVICSRRSGCCAEDLVPSDFIHARLGDVRPADVRLADGHIQVDQSTLTGESLPIEAESGQTAFAGSVVIRGEASGEVVATGRWMALWCSSFSSIPGYPSTVS